MSKRTSILAAVLFVFGSGCAPPADGSAAMSAITRANQHYIELHPKGDVDQLMAMYENDAVLLPPGAAPIQGRAAIRTYWSEFFAAWVVVEAKSVVDEIIVADNWAYGRGHYAETIRSKDGKTTTVETGKFSGIWRRQADGTWRIARDMWNDAPAGGSGS